MINLCKVKLVIWDLDDTFWNGTLSEGQIQWSEGNIHLVRALTDAGIINSISSKNDYNQVKDILTGAGLWELFVFPQISWNPKGEIIRDTIQEMNLRAENVLFIDDNPSNRNEAQFYSPQITVCGPELIPEIISSCETLPKKDPGHTRLQQYHLLEKKNAERKHAISNEEFLAHSRIRVSVGLDCENHVDRIHDLIMRTNQLNFTKKRISKEELIALLEDSSFSCGYVSVTDRYGNYGISGFYAMKNCCLEHFLFSCRVMGMGVEQYVYSVLRCPDLFVVGDTASVVRSGQTPEWINQDADTGNMDEKPKRNPSILPKMLFKGPCDIEQILGYLAQDESFALELTYINPETGVSIESYNHSMHIVQAKTVSKERQKTIISELPFSSPEFFSDQIYSNDNRIVFYSLFTDPNLGLYRRKETGEVVAFGEYCYDLTDRDNWKGYIDGTIFHANCQFSEKILEEFSNKYEYIGRMTPEQVLDNLMFIRKNMPRNTILVLFLGVELPYPDNTQKSYEDRHLYHQRLNALVRQWAENEENVTVQEFGDFVKSPREMFNNINHFIKPVYYHMAQRVIDIANQYAQTHPMKRRSWLYMQKTFLGQKMLLLEKTTAYQWVKSVKQKVFPRS